MRVLMLGWEFPPYITGGLGTACYGLTKALSRYGTQIAFVLPRNIAGSQASHVRLLHPGSLVPQPIVTTTTHTVTVAHPAVESGSALNDASGADSNSAAATSLLAWRQPVHTPQSVSSVIAKQTPGWLASPYQSAGGQLHQAQVITGQPATFDATGQQRVGFFAAPSFYEQQTVSTTWVNPYEGDLMSDTQRYAQFCVALARQEHFDVVHAHDWMTFPAGLAVAAATGKPLVVHVHSTEFDRSGQNVNQVVYDLERRGVHGAIRVIAVSHLTRSILVHRYGLDEAKVDVVYNGIESDDTQTHISKASIRRGDKIVLFLGRITWQKGPEFFIRAARMVLEKYDRVKFVMAGSGDRITQVIELAAAYGIGHKVVFTGFLHGADVERLFKMADVYVMPSISEPFGIAPLEAISHDVPVIISKSSGVAEVLTHALKVDFWDIEEMANKIIAVLKHPPLSSTLREQADMEVRRLSWDDAAAKCVHTYQTSLRVMGLNPR